MVLTNLALAQKNKDRVHLYFNDEYRGTVYIDFIIKYNIKIGDDINQEILDEIFSLSNNKLLFSLSVGYIFKRLRSEKEIREYISRKIITYKMNPFLVNIDSIVSKLYEYKYLNEELFAKSWAKSRLQKGFGPTRIQMELQQKGIEKNLSDNTLYNLSEEDKLNEVNRLTEKFLKKRTFANEREKEWKLSQFLRSRGF
jgi:regulatory protein